MHAVRGDGNCGCVDVGIDCKDQANWHAASVVDIIEMMVTSGNLMKNFLTFVLNRFIFPITCCMYGICICYLTSVRRK